MAAYNTTEKRQSKNIIFYGVRVFMDTLYEYPFWGKKIMTPKNNIGNDNFANL